MSIGIFHLVAATFVIWIAVMTDRRYLELPLLLRPATPVAFAAVVASATAGSMPPTDYGDYLLLWSIQILGFVAGMFVPAPKWDQHLQHRYIERSTLEKLAKWTFLLSVLSFLAFVGMKGVPILGSDIEQGRVDAAESGTGYLRLLAYMSGPSALCLVASRSSRRWAYVLTSAIIILALGNRSPLLYLFVPLIFYAWLGRSGSITKRFGNATVTVVVAVIAIGIVGIGTYRVVSQENFRSYSEYKADLAANDYLGVAQTVFEHYAGVVPENAILAKRLVDEGELEHKFGATYFTLFVTALPGEQMSLDREIKVASGKSFVGGGTPPTMMGEGYVNAGYVGTFIEAALVMWLVRLFATRALHSLSRDREPERTTYLLSYGYMLTWAATGQVAGLAGASTVPMAGLLAILVLTGFATKKTR